MLTAAASKPNKLRLEKGSLCEDEITSTVFGPLAYMSIENAWIIMRKIVEAADIATGLPQSTEVDNFNPEFWPKHKNDQLLGERSYVEPDMVFRFHFRDGSTFNVLIEVKWGAVLNPRCELIRQWLTRPVNDERWIHIYLVTQEGQGQQDRRDSIKILSEGCESCNNDHKCAPPRFRYQTDAGRADIWGNCLRTIDWRHIQKLADDLSRSDKEISEVIKRWSEGVRNFLSHEGYVPFTGFNWLADDCYQALDETDQISLFAKSNWFSFIQKIKFDVLDMPFEQEEYFMERRKH